MNSLPPTVLVLVAIMPSPKDLEIARVLGWYRIPMRMAPKIVDVDYIVFYQAGNFPKGHGGLIESYAEVLGHELTTRAELIRDEPDHPHAHEEYYKLQLGQLDSLPKPILAGRWKRITFFYTLGSLVNQAATINDLVVKSDEREILWKSLRERNSAFYAEKPTIASGIADEEFEKLIMQVIALNTGINLPGADGQKNPVYPRIIFRDDMKKIFKNGLIVTEKETKRADLLISGEKIIAMGTGLIPEPGTEVFNAEGLYILPGGVDVHVHLDLPMFGTVSSDDHYTGTKAAAFGGTTTVIDFISQDSDNLIENFQKLNLKAAEKAAIDYGFHANISHLTPEVEKQIPDLVKLGVTSVKVFTAYNNRLRLQDGEIFRVMRIAREAGILTMIHAENGDLIETLTEEAINAGHTSPAWHAKTRPAWGAVEAVCRGAALSAVADAPLYLVHMNAGGEVDQLEYARSKGLKVMGETCPQYLLFNDTKLEGKDAAKWVCSPPLRKSEDQQRLWQGLQTGTIQTIATDHCPFFYDGRKPILYEGVSVAIPGKELGKGNFTRIPNGLPGVGDRMPVLYTEMVGSGRFSINEFVKLNCSNPAKILGLYPQKGTLAVGSDADIVLWDPNKNVEYGTVYSQQRTDYNLYQGLKLTGYPIQVYSRGNLIMFNGEWFGKPGQGQYLPRKKFAARI